MHHQPTAHPPTPASNPPSEMPPLDPLPSWPDGLMVEDLGGDSGGDSGGEILVFDERRRLAFRLDGPTAMVFRACGQNACTAELVIRLGAQFQCDGRALLLASLEELRRRGLLPAKGLPHATRRQVLTTLARSAVVLPTILAVAVPSPAAAMSSTQVWLPSATASEPLSSEDYNPIRENEFRETLVQPVSTFSVDVDTASYSNLRRFLEADELPPRDAVRTEELLNYFTYDYPQPVDGRPFALWNGLAQCPWAEEHYVLHLGLQAQQLNGPSPPRNLVFLIDTSGSMRSADKLPLLQSAFRTLVDQLDGGDHVSIVAYAGSSGLVLPPTPGNDKERILAALDNLRSGGSTNGGAGLELAYRVAREHLDPAGVNRVMLATDGDFNVGISSRGELERLLTEQGRAGIFLTVLGFGRGNLKDDMLEHLAHHGDGQYAYIDSLQEARKVLVQQAGGTLVTIAKDVKVQLEFNPRQVAAYRLIGYENRLLQQEDFLDDRRDAGDVGAGHSVTVLYELIPETGVAPAETRPVEPLRYRREAELSSLADGGEIAHLRLRHKDPRGGASREITWPLTLTDLPPMDAATENQRLAAAIAGFAMLLRESSFRGTLDWPRVVELAESAIGSDAEGYRRQLVTLMRRAAALSGAEVGRALWPW